MQIEVVSLVGTTKVIKGEPVTGAPLLAALEQAKGFQLIDDRANTINVPFFNRKHILTHTSCHRGLYTKDNMVDRGGIPYSRCYIPCIIHEFVSQIIFIQDDKPHGIAAGEVYEEKTIYVILPEGEPISEGPSKSTPIHPCDSASCWACDRKDCEMGVEAYEGN